MKSTPDASCGRRQSAIGGQGSLTPIIRNLRRSKIFLAVLVATFAVCAHSQTLPPGVQQKASAGGITEYQFPNGLRVLLYPDDTNLKITVNVTYLVG